MTEPIKLALIGAGLFARDAHAPALLALGDTYEIAAVYSRTAESTGKLNALLPSPVEEYHDLVELLARDDIEAVDITLPIDNMPHAIMMALKAGKHIVSEKPMAPDLEVGQHLLAAYEGHTDLVWMVAENYRYEAPLLRAAEIVASGEIGHPLLMDWAIHVSMTAENKYYHTEWRRADTFQGGFLLDGGVHHVAGMRMVLGEIASVSASTTQRRVDLPPADTLTASMQFENGTLGSYSVTYAGGAPWYGALQIVGDRGAVRILRDGEIEVTAKGQTRLEKVEGFNGVRAELAAFAAAIREGQAHHNGPAEALQDVAVVEAMLRSAASGQRVNVARVVV